MQDETVVNGHHVAMTDADMIALMTDRDIMREILTRLRSYEETVRGLIEAGKKNPMLAQMLRAYGIPV